MKYKLTSALGVTAIAVALVGAFELGRRQADQPAEESTETSTEEGREWHVETEGEGESESDVGGADEAEPSGFASNPTFAPLETLVSDLTHPTVQLVDPLEGQGAKSLVLVGAPGIWPPATMMSDAKGVVYLPDTDVETLDGGEFHQFELMARGSSGPLAYWGSVDFGRAGQKGEPLARRLRLERASPVEVTILGVRGEPVADAEVQLSRETIGFISLSKQTGPDGTAKFRTVPGGNYVLSGRSGEDLAGRVGFDHRGDERTSLTIRLEEAPEMFAPEGSGDPETSTDGKPRDVHVTLGGLREEDWTEMSVDWRRAGGSWQTATLQKGPQEGRRHWQHRLPAGSYQLRAVHPSGARDVLGLEVGDGSATRSWEIQLMRDRQFYVVDDYGAPVEGALVQVWQQERLLGSELSRGNEPVSFRLDARGTYRVVAIDGERGESIRTVDMTGDSPETVLRLDAPLFSSEYPPGRLEQPGRIETILGAPVIPDGSSWVLDVRTEESRAAKAGLERGDYLMSVHRRQGHWTVIVERDGQVVELDLPEAE
jgi:hypothetical protein